ncbi:MAG TPA: hypothetical protein VLI45_00775, partial [Acidobacteriaceae bacterium]|nr:hypothetical protein [Acidobacteriaceae bacterium]
MEAPERSHWRQILSLAAVTHFSMGWLFLRHFPGPSVSFSSLSLENVFIALSLHAGHGFSSPFGAPSGPTACLPPIYPFIIYIVTQVVGTGKAAVLSMLFMQIMCSLATVLAAMYLAQRD